MLDRLRDVGVKRYSRNLVGHPVSYEKLQTDINLWLLLVKSNLADSKLALNVAIIA